MPTNQARAQEQQAPQPSQFPPVGTGNNPDAGKMGNSQEINKKSESLRKYTGNPADFIDWSSHFIDHMAKVHISWRYTLEWVFKTKENLSMSRLRTDWLGPYREHAADLAVKLEQLMVDYLPSTQYRKRKQLCGGEGEQGNGCQMWRRLFEDNRGSGGMVEYAGIEVLCEYKACTKIYDVSAHTDAWKELLDTYGSELMTCPRLLRSMLLNIIPKDLKTEIVKKPKLINAD